MPNSRDLALLRPSQVPEWRRPQTAVPATRIRSTAWTARPVHRIPQMFPIPAREARQGIPPQVFCKKPTTPSISTQSGARSAAESGFLSVQGRSHAEASIPHCQGTEPPAEAAATQSGWGVNQMGDYTPLSPPPHASNPSHFATLRNLRPPRRLRPHNLGGGFIRWRTTPPLPRPPTNFLSPNPWELS